MEERGHHCVILRKSDNATVNVFGFKVFAEADLDAAHTFFAAQGLPVAWIIRPFMGRTLRTTDPHAGKQAWVAYAPILIDPLSDETDGAPRAEMSLAIVSTESPVLEAAQGLLVTQALVALGWLILLFVAIIVVARSSRRPSHPRA